MKKYFQWSKNRYAFLQLGLRIALGLFICAAAISAVYIGKKPYEEELKEGDISLRTIYSPIDFKYRISIDEEKTKLAREKAADAVDEIYDIDPQITQDIINKIDEFLKQVIAAQDLKGTFTQEERINTIKSSIKIDVPAADLEIFLAEKEIGQLSGQIVNLVQNLLEKGIIDSDLKKKIAASKRDYVTLRTRDEQIKKKVAADSFLTMDKAKDGIVTSVQALVPEKRKLRIAIIDLIGKIIQPNMNFNEELTLSERQTAYDTAETQYKYNEVKRQELIITKGTRVMREHLLKINEMSRLQVKVNRFMFFSGAAILALILLVIVSIYLKTFEPKIFLDTRKLILIGILSVLILAMAKLITYSSLPSYVIPTAIASIMMTLLIGPRVSIIITVVLSIFVGIIAGDKLNIATVSFVGSIVGIFSIRGARRRSQILIAGCLVGLASFFSICAIGLLHELEYSVFLRDGALGIISGIVSAIIVTGFLPVFEYLFNMVTDISLLELSDLNHPLLKEMVLKATGTYHHSLIVGNLAEAACSNIKANPLLARVGSYFHDIGKVEKAEYFSENQLGAAKEKHDKLTPSMSSLIITNHVKDGVELARKYKLNQAVIDFIEQHHGTSLIYYFYQRALEKIEDDVIPKEEGFRYPGPKPQTKETAVVLLADSVEAASRSLSEPTPARVKTVVRKIINNKFIDNQLDQCELTLKDLEVIADTFSRILMGVLHSRVEYDTGENKKYPEKGPSK